jgi:hypothetical protein
LSPKPSSSRSVLPPTGAAKYSASTSEIRKNEGFWTAFLRSLKVRGLDRVKLVISDAHSGLKKASGTVFQGASW